MLKRLCGVILIFCVGYGISPSEHFTQSAREHFAQWEQRAALQRSLEIAQLQEMGLGIVLLVAILVVIFGALYFIDRKNGFVDSVFRKITIPQGKTAQIIAGIFIGLQIVAILGYSLTELSNISGEHSNLFLVAVTIITMLDIGLMCLCCYINIKFLYRYQAFWLYLVLFGISNVFTKVADRLNVYWLFVFCVLFSNFIAFAMIFHYVWYCKNQYKLKESQQNKPKNEPTDDVQERLIVGFLLGEFAEAELIQSLQHFVPKAQMDTMLPRLVTDKLLLNRILSGASEMTSDSLQMSAIAVSVADQMNQYLRGEMGQIPEALSNLVAIADRGSFWRIHKTLLQVWIVEKGKQSFKQMDETERAMFLNALAFLYGTKALEEFLKQV